MELFLPRRPRGAATPRVLTGMVSQARRRRYWTMVLRHPDIDDGRGDSRRQYSAVFGERFKTVASICFGGPNRGVWAFPAIGRPTRTSDGWRCSGTGVGRRRLLCGQAARSHLFPYAVKM